MNNRAILGDCMEVMERFKYHEFDLAVVDPPYGIFKERKQSSILKKNFGKMGAEAHQWDGAPGKEYFDELKRVSKNWIIWGGNYFLGNLGVEKAPSVIVWNKQTGSNYFADGELAITSFQTGTLRIFTWQQCGVFSPDYRRGVERIHPTQKPVDLYKWIFTRYAKPGQKILDTHLGSGSSRIAAYDLGLDFLGIEISPEFFALQEKRFEEHIKQQELFELDQATLFVEGV